MYLPQALDASASASSLLEGRQLGRTRYRTRRTPWSSWGRWVLAGILIAVALVLVFLVLCLRARKMKRNRKMGMGATQAPIQSHNHVGNPTGQPPMTDNYGYSAQPGYGGAPPPGPPPNYGGGANGYYGQQSGIAQPPGAHYK